MAPRDINRERWLDERTQDDDDESAVVNLWFAGAILVLSLSCTGLQAKVANVSGSTAGEMDGCMNPFHGCVCVHQGRVGGQHCTTHAIQWARCAGPLHNTAIGCHRCAWTEWARLESTEINQPSAPKREMRAMSAKRQLLSHIGLIRRVEVPQTSAGISRRNLRNRTLVKPGLPSRGYHMTVRTSSS